MHRVDLPEQDKIQFLVSEITVVPLRATVLSLWAEMIDDFLDEKDHPSIAEFNKRSLAPNTFIPTENSSCLKIVGRKAIITRNVVMKQAVLLLQGKRAQTI